MRLLFVLAALILSLVPASAAERLVFGGTFEGRAIRVVLHFPQGADRAAEGRCSAEQQDALRDRIGRFLGFSAAELIAAHPGTRPIAVDRSASCGPAGTVTLSRFDPADPVVTELYEPGEGWRIVG